MKTLLAAALILFAAAATAEAARVECITGASVEVDACGTGCNLSLTGIRTKSKTTTYNFEVYSDERAVSSPATCVAPDTTVVTCNGFDSTGSVELWMKCDRNAPFLLMEFSGPSAGVVTFTEAGANGRALMSDCFVRLRVVDPGTTNSACFYLGVTGVDIKSDDEVQEGSTKGSWAVTEFDN